MSDENNVDENYVSDSKETVAPPDRKPIEIAAVLLEISNQDDKKWLLDNIIGFNRNVEQKTSILFAVIGQRFFHQCGWNACGESLRACTPGRFSCT